MKIINAINFYYGLFPIISLCVEMNKGITGRYHDFTKEQALDFLNGYEDEKVIEIKFQTHSIFKGQATTELTYPMLYIKYI